MRTSERHYESLRESLISKLKTARVDMDIVTMPDFFLDHSLTYDRDAKSLTKSILSVASKGGGEIPNVPQSLEVGGNAAICTLSLATLGARVHLFAKTSRLGFSIMKFFYEHLGVDLAHVNVSGNLSPTIILELMHGKRMANVMIGDLSSVSDFGFDDLNPDDLATIANARYVCVFNWLYNRRGTELAEKVFTYCKTKTDAYTFFDPADPRPRKKELPTLASKVLRSELLDALGVNENEAITIAGVFNKKASGLTKKESIDAAALQAGKMISANTGVKVHVHTATYSSSIKGDRIDLVPSFEVPMRRGTGAGDCWNAGNLVAQNLNLTEEEKLLFANAVAARYISNARRAHSTVKDVADFLQNRAHKLKEVMMNINR